MNLLPDGGHSVAWTTKEFNLHWNTAVHRDGYLYGFHGRNEPDAQLVCLRLKDGTVVWRETPEWEEEVRVGGETRQMLASTLRGSLLWADGRFLALGEHGHLLWLASLPTGLPGNLARQAVFCPPNVGRSCPQPRSALHLPKLARGIRRLAVAPAVL